MLVAQECSERRVLRVLSFSGAESRMIGKIPDFTTKMNYRLFGLAERRIYCYKIARCQVLFIVIQIRQMSRVA